MMHVLVVDDEQDIGELYRQHFRKELKAAELSLYVANSGEEAIRILEDINHLQPLLVFSDINMPGMSGFDLLKIIRQRWPEQKTILVSAYAGNEKFQEQANILHADDFLRKPIDFGEIKARFNLLNS